MMFLVKHAHALPHARRPFSHARPPTPGAALPRAGLAHPLAQPPRQKYCPVFEKSCIFASQTYNAMSTQKIDPKGIKKWIAIIIAVLSAIAGALGESATGVATHILGNL